MSYRYLPNIISLLRLLLVVPIVILLWQQAFLWAFCLFLIASLSDWIDGFLARRLQISSPLGCILDPLADKLLMLGCFVMLTWHGWIPIWICAVVMARDGLIALGAWYYYVYVEKVIFEASRLSKFNTCCQIAYLISLFVMLSLMISLPWYVIIGLMWLMIIITILSAIQYSYLFMQRIKSQG